MSQDVSDRDFVNSFLKAARLRKMSAVVIYVTNEAGRAQLRMTSNVGPVAAQGILAWIKGQNITPEMLGEAPAAEEPPAS